jgi:hypothetical protein
LRPAIFFVQNVNGAEADQKLPGQASLAETLARVMATGLSISEAQRDICRALGDGKLRARYRIRKVETPLGGDVSRRLFGQPLFGADSRNIIGRPRIPADLCPDEFDWENSRPRDPWRDGCGFRVHIAKLELSTADVIRVLSSGGSVSSSAGATSATENAATNALTSLLKSNPEMKRKDAEAWCASEGFPTSRRGFQFRV